MSNYDTTSIKTRLIIFGFFLFSSIITFSQNFPYADISIMEDGKVLSSPYAGGLNEPQFSQIHLNSDNLVDLFIFERGTEEVLCFYAFRTSGNKIRYRFAPDEAKNFPSGLKHWATLADYNCDGLPDLFTASFGFGGITVFENTGSQGSPAFTIVAPTLFNQDGTSPLYADTRDLPAFIDVDNDGDLDILAFESGGFSVNWFHNRALEDSGRCGPLAFAIEDACWGNFQENGSTNAVNLNIACKRGGPKHAGSTICAFDDDGDGIKDILLGDLNFNNLVYLHNGGTLIDATMDSSVFNYPSGSPVNIHLFPSAFWIDVDLDGRKDLLASTNAPNVGANYEQTWFYRDAGTSQAASWDFVGKDFLSNEMIEVGSYSKPVFFDENGDGRLDMLIGNYVYRDNRDNSQAALTLYRNVGGRTTPVFELTDRNYLNISNLIGPTDNEVAPSFADIDGDGDEDLLIGTFSGKLFYFINTPQVSGEASFAFSSTLFQNIDIGQHAMPSFGDIDNDGDIDLVVGENGGNLNLFTNTGDAQNPVFGTQPTDDFWGEIDVTFGNLSGYSAPVLVPQGNRNWTVVVGTEEGILMQYAVQASGKFPTLDSIWSGADMGIRATPALADLDDDGQAELAIGGKRGGIALLKTPVAVSLEKEVLSNAERWHIGYGAYDNDLLIAPTTNWRHASVSIFDIQGKQIASWTIKQGEEMVLPAIDKTGIVYISIIPTNSSPFTLKYLLR